jgi:quinoprotein dehydrogenase-associated probable ABC transporter substrate-binding protein
MTVLVIAASFVCAVITGCSSPPSSHVRMSSPRAGLAPAQPSRVLHVVADPNNLPFSNDKLEGFENRIAELIAREMGAKVEYAWRAQRRGFFRHAFQDDGGDVVLGVPAGFERAITTAPYYRSSYTFVYRDDRNLDIKSLDDPALRTLKIGIQLAGDESSGPPPAFALAKRGLVDNLVGYSIYGDYTQPNPPARVIDAVAAGDVDVAIVWGPLAGYFAKRAAVPLKVVPVSPEVDPPAMHFAFDISVGVRKSGRELRDEINQILARNRGEVEKILDAYAVPRAASTGATNAAGPPQAVSDARPAARAGEE